MPPLTAPLVLGVLVLGGLVVLAPRLLARAAGALRMAGLLRGGRGVRTPDLGRASAYHERLPAAERAGALDGRTWADLDLDAVFLALDRTASEPGRQVLYHRLRTPEQHAAPLLRFERAVQALSANAPAAARARAALGRLADPRAGHLVDLLFGELPARPRVWWLFPVLTAGSAALLALSLSGLWPAAAVGWVALCALNVLVQLVPVAALADERRALGGSAGQLRALGRATWWLKFEPGQTNELAASVYEYVNLAFLLDVNAFVLAVDTLRARRGDLRAVFEALAAIDVAQSVAAWRAELPRWTTPEFTGPQKALRADGLVHPLVEGAVPNALALDGAGALVTGSNMSGKSTYVRAADVGAVLAQTLHTVCAARWRGPLLRVRTSIGRADSVVEGRSYYLAEAESVRALVRAADGEGPEGGAQHLFLLDEIFRGTNTTERVAAGAAVLAYLNQGAHLVVVATHDLEPLDLLGSDYAAYHFREQVADGSLTFDYRLHPGPSSTRNAIALLEVLRYPDVLVAAARAAVDGQRGRSDPATQSRGLTSMAETDRGR